MIVAVTKHALTSGQLSRDIIQFHLQSCRFSVTQVLFAQAAKVMIEEETQLPRQLGFVKSEPAGDRVPLERFGCSRLNAGDKLYGLLNQNLALFFRDCF